MLRMFGVTQKDSHWISKGNNIDEETARSLYKHNFTDVRIFSKYYAEGVVRSTVVGVGVGVVVLKLRIIKLQNFN